MAQVKCPVSSTINFFTNGLPMHFRSINVYNTNAGNIIPKNMTFNEIKLSTPDNVLGSENSWAFCTEHAPNLARNPWGEEVKFNMAAYDRVFSGFAWLQYS